MRRRRQRRAVAETAVAAGVERPPSAVGFRRGRGGDARPFCHRRGRRRRPAALVRRRRLAGRLFFARARGTPRENATTATASSAASDAPAGRGKRGHYAQGSHGVSDSLFTAQAKARHGHTHAHTQTKSRKNVLSETKTNKICC